MGLLECLLAWSCRAPITGLDHEQFPIIVSDFRFSNLNRTEWTRCKIRLLSSDTWRVARATVRSKIGVAAPLAPHSQGYGADYWMLQALENAWGGRCAGFVWVLRAASAGW